MSDKKHYEKSSYREKMIEHIFVAKLLEHDWLTDDPTLEIARAEVDNVGHDIIAEKGNVIRHIQLKASTVDSKTIRHNIHSGLHNKPAGCVVWIFFKEEKDKIELAGYLFFGNSKLESKPGTSSNYILMPMEDIGSNTEKYKVARHNKRNKEGERGERDSLRVVKKIHFTESSGINLPNLEKRLLSFDELYELLFPGANNK